MLDGIASFVAFWGVWLVVPLLIDGLTTLASLVGVLVARSRRPQAAGDALNFYPYISIVIPVHNSQDTLEACLRSIASQDYPAASMEILLVNNGSQDRSFEIFAGLQSELPLQISWYSILNEGKAWALNAGIHLTHGTYIFNIDSDVVLESDAIRRVVEAMEHDPRLGAVTGAVEVLPQNAQSSPFLRVLATCEFLEYLTAFQVGRQQQTLLDNLYTLSGAFSAFRREILLNTHLYSQNTITEDTDMTFDLYERFANRRIGCVSTATAYVHPISSLSALYAQRVRWQRGQIEVSARHKHLMERPIWKLRGFAPARVLAIDHTLAFPRLVWTFLLPVLTLYGYPLSLLFMAWVVLYGFYMLIDILWVVVAALGSTPAARQRLRQSWWLFGIMPLYRMLIFWFRFSGFLSAVAEPGAWRVQDPVKRSRQGWLELKSIIGDRISPLWAFTCRIPKLGDLLQHK
jgi:biofilm PGA synthesis N-glycosyltransferase PgaC